jgi:ketosteroid isomerase-like protein
MVADGMRGPSTTIRGKHMRLLKVAALAAAASCALAACQKPAVDAAAIETELKQKARDWSSALNAGDLDTVVAAYAPDAVVMAPGNTAVSGHEAIRALFADLGEVLRTSGATFAFNEGDMIGVSGELAWHSGGYALNDAGGAAIDGGNYLVAYQNVDGKWLIVRDIWNSDRPPPPAEGDAPL